MKNYLFLSKYGSYGFILSSENKQQAVMQFLISWNYRYYQEWKFELTSWDENQVCIFSNKMQSTLIFYIVETETNESKFFQFID